MELKIEGYEKTFKQIDDLILKNGLEGKIKSIINAVLKRAASSTSDGIRSALANDPHQSYKAVKKLVYKRLLGGNISILDQRRKGGRSGNVSAYTGAERGYILRFLNSGAGLRRERETRNKARRGSVQPMNFFQPAASKAMAVALDEISVKIEKLYKELNNG